MLDVFQWLFITHPGWLNVFTRERELNRNLFYSICGNSTHSRTHSHNTEITTINGTIKEWLYRSTLFNSNAAFERTFILNWFCVYSDRTSCAVRLLIPDKLKTLRSSLWGLPFSVKRFAHINARFLKENQ